jgi:hypothetical protein
MCSGTLESKEFSNPGYEIFLVDAFNIVLRLPVKLYCLTGYDTRAALDIV